MDDSDDYFQDSFELNEDDLAILDQEEEKHIREVITKTQQQSAPFPAPVPEREREPPPKRQKVVHEADEADDIVDVFIQPNGLYGIESDPQQARQTVADSRDGKH